MHVCAWQCLETCMVITLAGRVLPASSGWRPWMPLNILQCAGWPPTAELICPQMLIVLRLRNPDLNLCDANCCLPGSWQFMVGGSRHPQASLFIYLPIVGLLLMAKRWKDPVFALKPPSVMGTLGRDSGELGPPPDLSSWGHRLCVINHTAPAVGDQQTFADWAEKSFNDVLKQATDDKGLDSVDRWDPGNLGNLPCDRSSEETTLGQIHTEWRNNEWIIALGYGWVGRVKGRRCLLSQMGIVVEPTPSDYCENAINRKEFTINEKDFTINRKYYLVPG